MLHGEVAACRDHAVSHLCQREVCCDVHKRMAMRFVEAGAGSVGRKNSHGLLGRVRVRWVQVVGGEPGCMAREDE